MHLSVGSPWPLAKGDSREADGGAPRKGQRDGRAKGKVHLWEGPAGRRGAPCNKSHEGGTTSRW